jgi:MYXO-CTERM domain-containing protein
MSLSRQGFRCGGLVLLPAALMLAPALASASVVYGEFGIEGPGFMLLTSLGASDIQFCTDSDPTCSSSPTATGDFSVSGPGNGSFTALAGGTAGVVDNVATAISAPSPYTPIPVGAPVNVDTFLALAGFSTWDFRVNLLAPATCIPTPTQQCSGPFQFDQSGPNVIVSFNAFGTLINTVDGSTSIFDMTVVGQYDSMTIAAVEAAAGSSTGILSDSWSASVDATPTPEPGTASMMWLAAGALALGFRSRRRRNRFS